MPDTEQPEASPLKSVLVTITNEQWIHRGVVHKIMLLMQDPRYKLHIIMPYITPYENNLHRIVNTFMASKCEFWLNIDSDNPPMDNPLDLIELDLDIVGCPTPVWHFTNTIENEKPIYENVYKYVSNKHAYTEWIDKDGLQEVDAVGTGCILISRRVFENPEMRKAPFRRKLNPDGTVRRGTDISFCERAKKNGFIVHAHYDYRCQHHNELELNEIMNAFYKLNKGYKWK